jgi:hypoxanthine phosphoribosyltransferase
VLEVLGRCTFPPAGAPLACGVSGGPDSLALMVLGVAAGCRVQAIHVDHGLRAGSAEEAGRVVAAARRWQVPVRCLQVAVASGPNLEARARQARYGALPGGVATGHTMDDQAETVLLNVLRGSGLDGLAGMRPGPARPLLGVRRRETRAICEAVGLAWFEDPSNEDPRHLRNRVRRELLPLCKAIAGRDVVPLLARLADLASSDVALLDELALGGTEDPGDVRALRDHPPALARRVVRSWLRQSGATPASGGDAGLAHRHPPTLAEVSRVLAVATGEARATELRGGFRVRRSAGHLRLDSPADQLASLGERSGTITPVRTEEAAPPSPVWAPADVGPVVVSAEALAVRVAELGAQITADYADDPPLLVGVLKGAMLFMSDLCRAIRLPVEVDFMAVSSYGSATTTSGVVRIVKDLDSELSGRRVLVVEDIIDSGLTLNYLSKYLQARNPRSLDVCALLLKAGVQRVDLKLRYVGFRIPSEFVVGYGLDVAERYRNLTGVHRYLGPEVTETGDVR